MLEGKELEKAIAQIMKRLRIVNITYIKKIAAQIKKIGELNPSSVNRLVAMSDMNADIAEIRELLRVAAAVNAKELRQVFTKAVTETKNDPRFARYLAKYPLKDSAKQRVERFVQSLYRQTAANMYNYSNTTAITQGYSEAIDKAVLASATGVSSYTETMRDTIREIGHAGLQVQYESGYRRRLDTAVRQNIVDAVNQINKKASIMMGEEINEDAGENIYDAIEISAHARSAPDHEPVQGHVFMKEEWEKLQSGLVSRDIDGRMFEGFRRPIGEWNCRHTPLSFSTKYSQRMWTNEQLHEFIEENQKGCVIDGKHKTLYEAMQMMRDIETAVRREKDTAIAAKEAGDDALRQECQRNINSLVRRYAQIAKASGNAEKRQRMTVEGFKPVKVPPSNPEKPTNNPQPPENSQKGLTSGGKSAIVKAITVKDIGESDKGKDVSDECKAVIADTLKAQGVATVYDKVRVVDIPRDDDNKIEPLRTNAIASPGYPTVVLEINKAYFAGRSLEQINSLVKVQDFSVAENLKELVIHECAHAKILKDITYARYEALDQELKGSRFTDPIAGREDGKSLKELAGGVSEYAQKDGLECVAECHILLERGETIDSSLKELHDDLIK